MLYKILSQMLFALFLSISTITKSDFFAFRKLVHPKTGKIVYLLYDIHCSKIISASSYKSSKEQIYKELKEIERSIKWSMGYKKESDPKIIEKAESFYNNFPNLIKQRQDLLDIVQKYNISLIDEDWPSIDNDLFMTHGPGLHKNFYSHYFGSEDCVVNDDKYYRMHVTPMLGIGKKLTGKFTIREFVKFNTDAYFFNSDARTRGGLQAGHGSSEQVDSKTIDAINQLFTKYNQNFVIIAEGFEHIINIAKELVGKGYKPGPFIISSDLKSKRNEFPNVNQMLEYCESLDDKKDFCEKLNNEESEEVYYSLIANPLDIKNIFDVELKRNDSNSSCSSYLSVPVVETVNRTTEKKPKLEVEVAAENEIILPDLYFSVPTNNAGDNSEENKINNHSEENKLTSYNYKSSNSLLNKKNVFLVLGILAGIIAYKRLISKIPKHMHLTKRTYLIGFIGASITTYLFLSKYKTSENPSFKKDK